MEEAFVCVHDEDVLAPEEGEMIICEGQGRQWREVSNGAVKEHGNAAHVDWVTVR